MPQPGVADLVSENDLKIPVLGETAAATRIKPASGAEKAPVLLMYFPYRKDDHLTYGAYSPLLEYFALNDYNVVIADIIGTGASSGQKETPANSSVEGKEGAAIVEWLAEQEWSTGRVGVFGKSYGGLTCLSTAAEQPEGLGAIMPMYTSTGGYRDQNGGIFDPYTWAGHWNPQMQALQGLPTSNKDAEGRWADVWKEHLAQLERGNNWLFESMNNEVEDELWTQKEAAVENIEVPTFGVSGWRDFAPASTLEYLAAIDAPTRGLIGPWRHTMGHRGREVAIDMRRQAVEWFDHFLKDEQNGALDHAPIEFWTERNGGGKIGAGSWREAESWPSVLENPSVEGMETISFACTPDGLLSESEYDGDALERKYKHDQTVGMHSVDMGFPIPADTNQDDVRSLCFETKPLGIPVEYTGTGAATVRVKSSIPDPILSVRVVDVAPDGAATLVSHGRLRLTHRNGHKDTDEVVPGEEYSVTVPLKPKSHVFEEGHQIRFAIAASHFPIALATRKQGTFTIVSDPESPTHLKFPGRIHDIDVTFPDAFEMADPDESLLPTEPPYVTPERSVWRTSRDHINDTATVFTSSGKSVDLPHGPTMTFSQDIEATVQAQDPSSMVVYSDTEMTIDYGTETAVADITCRASRDSTQYTTAITVDDQRVFEKTFTR